MNGKTALFHNECHTLVFWYDHPPTPGEALTANNSTLPDGSKPEPASLITCLRCERSFPIACLTWRGRVGDRRGLPMGGRRKFDRRGVKS